MFDYIKKFKPHIYLLKEKKYIYIYPTPADKETNVLFLGSSGLHPHRLLLYSLVASLCHGLVTAPLANVTMYNAELAASSYLDDGAAVFAVCLMT